MPTTRRATPDDQALVCEITNAAYEGYVAEFGGPPLPMLEDYAPHIAAGGVWLVANDGAVAGLAVFETAADHLMIFSLAVLPDAQRAGIGRFMLQFAEDQARAAGLPEVRLYTNSLMHRNIRVYEQAGFIHRGRRPNDRHPGWFFVDMAKLIPAIA